MIAQLEDLKDYLGLSSVTASDTPLLVCLTAADAIMKTYCNRTFEYIRYNQNITPITNSEILTPNFPLITVNGMTAFQSFDDTIGIASNMDYVKWYRSGKIFSTEGLFVLSPNSVQIDYYAGLQSSDSEWDTLKWIQMEIAGELFRGRGMLHIQQYQSGGAQLQRIGESSADFISMLSPEILITLGMFTVRGPRIDY